MKRIFITEEARAFSHDVASCDGSDEPIDCYYLPRYAPSILIKDDSGMTTVKTYSI